MASTPGVSGQKLLDRSNWSQNITQRYSQVLDQPPSCMEFVPEPIIPIPGIGFGEYFVVGTYQLLENSKEYLPHHCSPDCLDDEGVCEIGASDQMKGKIDLEVDLGQSSVSQSKIGSLVLFKLSNGTLHRLQTLPCSTAVFDLHFFPTSQMFGVVSSNGQISLYTIEVLDQGVPQVLPGTSLPSSAQYGIKHLITHQVFSETTNITSFNWYPSNQTSLLGHPDSLMAVTTEDGGVYLVRFQEHPPYTFTILNDGDHVIKHDDQALWSVFDKQGTLYSAGDDGKVRLRQLVPFPFTRGQDIEAREVDNAVIGGHEAGVTSILLLPIQTPSSACIFLTGSYDDKVRIWTTQDTRSCRPRVLAELNIGGSAWRTKFLQSYPELGWDETVKYLVLASCSYEGSRILEVEGSRSGDWSIKVIARMQAHESMCYASDVQPITTIPPDGYNAVRNCVTTSFYDRLLTVWDFDPTGAREDASSLR